MKKLIFQIILICSCIPFATHAQRVSILDPTLTIFPAPPLTTLDSITAGLSGEFPSTGFSIESGPLVAISANNIDISLYITSPTGIVLPVLIPFTVDAPIGRLDPGTYDVRAWFYVDNALDHQIKDSFTVSAIPLPAAVWLLGSGLIVLIGLARRRKA